MEQILAALISAAASVLVAWISKGTSQQPPAAATPTGTGELVQGGADGRAARKPWLITLSILIVWLMIAPIAIHHDFPGINLFVIIVVTLAAAALWPIRSLTAAAIVLALHPLNLFMEPVAKFLHGARGEYMWGGYDSSKVTLLLVIFVGNALIVASVCAWRLRSRKISTPLAPVTVAVKPPEPANPRPDDLAANLERLAALHKDGKLTDDEFNSAKRRLLSG